MPSILLFPFVSIRAEARKLLGHVSIISIVHCILLREDITRHVNDRKVENKYQNIGCN
jgi:NTP pyrophosphatase (non-canonical NTP hydrolase)